LLSAAWDGDEREEQVTLEQVPPQVRAAILRETTDGVILEIVREVEGAEFTFEVEVLFETGGLEIEFAADGTVIERDALELGDEDDDEEGEGDEDDDDEGEDDDGEQIPVRALPVAVRRALGELAGDHDFVTSVEREHGVTVYEARWEEAGRSIEVEVTAEGDLLEIEEIVAAESVPAAVCRAAEVGLPGAVVLTYRKKTVFNYEVEAVIDGREHEVLIHPTGRFLDDE
jgi:hypothetical protein